MYFDNIVILILICIVIMIFYNNILSNNCKYYEPLENSKIEQTTTIQQEQPIINNNNSNENNEIDNIIDESLIKNVPYAKFNVNSTSQELCSDCTSNNNIIENFETNNNENQNDNFLNNIVSYTEKSTNRYNRKKNNIIFDEELQNISLKNVIHKNDLESFENININNNNNLNILTDYQTDFDSQIYLKSKKDQNKFKKSKTISSKFTKNLMNNNFEYNFEENKRTEPWWETEQS